MTNKNDHSDNQIVNNGNYELEIIRKQNPSEDEGNPPLFIGCSGGGGHNTAIVALINAYKQSGHEPISYPIKIYPNKIQDGLHSQKIAWGVYLLSKGFIAQLTKMTFLPHLPTQHEILEEIQLIINQEECLTKNEKGVPSRAYVDMLLDVDPNGHMKAAIWNRLQKKDKLEDLKKLIAFQQYSDLENYECVKNYFITKLEAGERSVNGQKPYSEIISTQAMSLPALADAVLTFNQKYQKNIKIKQYFTDIVTKGAVHFFNALGKLTTAQKKQFILNGVHLKDYLAQNPQFDGFFDCIDIKPEKNLMLRQAFLDVKQLKSITSDQSLELKTKKNSIIYPIFIPAFSKVGTIMLGSQGGEDTFQYVKTMAFYCDKIFIFGGKKKEISRSIDEFLSEMPLINRAQFEQKMIRLENQDADQIAPIMCRSDFIIIRGGGLSVMEQMAVALNLSSEMAKRKIIFIHHKESGSISLTSGIEWEDQNANNLISFLQKCGIRAFKTSTVRFIEQIKGEEALKTEFIFNLDNYITEKKLKIENRKMISKDTVINMIPLLSSHMGSTKISAASKMKTALKGNLETFEHDEVVALEKGSLNVIVRYYERLMSLPDCYLKARNQYLYTHSLKNSPSLT